MYSKNNNNQILCIEYAITYLVICTLTRTWQLYEQSFIDI